MKGFWLVLVVVLSGCATLTEDAMTPVALSFSDGTRGTCGLSNKRGGWQLAVPGVASVRKSDDALRYNCQGSGGRLAAGAIPSSMGGKIVASAVFLDFGIVDAITDKHRQYPASYVIPIEPLSVPATQSLSTQPPTVAAPVVAVTSAGQDSYSGEIERAQKLSDSANCGQVAANTSGNKTVYTAACPTGSLIVIECTSYRCTSSFK